MTCHAHTLILLRHAKSDWDGEEPDRQRPLARRGIREAPDAGRWLAVHQPDIALAVVSPAQRVAETWALVSAELPDRVPAQIVEHIYDASVEDLLDVVRELPPDAGTVLLVGHNPGLEQLVHALTGRLVPMPTSALAVVALPGQWSAAGRSEAVLQAHGRPPG